jgi:hypothetical protein
MTETLVSTSNPYEPICQRIAGSVGKSAKGVNVCFLIYLNNYNKNN